MGPSGPGEGATANVDAATGRRGQPGRSQTGQNDFWGRGKRVRHRSSRSEPPDSFSAGSGGASRRHPGPGPAVGPKPGQPETGTSPKPGHSSSTLTAEPETGPKPGHSSSTLTAGQSGGPSARGLAPQIGDHDRSRDRPSGRSRPRPARPQPARPPGPLPTEPDRSSGPAVGPWDRWYPIVSENGDIAHMTILRRQSQSYQ
jgi:hypothetical protein